MQTRQVITGIGVVLVGMVLLLVDIQLFFSQTLKQHRCRETAINPIESINWRMIFPIRIGRITFNPGGGSEESLMTDRSGLCHCSGESPGIAVSFHQPRFIQEIITLGGCFPSLGGMSLFSEPNHFYGDIDTSASTARFQVHWYTFPVFSLLDIFKGLRCASQTGFKLVYASEMDPTWQDDEWAAVYHPAGIQWANNRSQSACYVDAVAATRGHPLDNLFWCAGSLGSIYPLTGNANSAVGRLQAAELIGAKSIAKLSQQGKLSRTVGQDALCHKQPMPVWVKSQFSLDPISPVVYKGPGLPIGAAPSVWQYRPPQSLPGHESVVQIVFQEVQCCIHP